MLVWLLSPRNSLAPAVACVVLGSLFWLAIGRRHRLVWPALVLASVGLVAAGWRLSIVWIPRSLDVDFARTVYLWCPEEGIPEPRSARMRDDAFKRLFSRVRVKPGVSKVNPRWWIRFSDDVRSVTFRVTDSGQIVKDVPASAFQDVYVPVESGLRELIWINLMHIRDRTK